MNHHDSQQDHTSLTPAIINSNSVTFVSDVEGNWDYWIRFLSISSCFSIESPETLERKILLNNGYTFVYGGDVCDKGSGDIRILRDLLQIKNDYPNRVELLMGIRDTNKLRLHFELHEAQMFKSYKHFDDDHLPPSPTCPESSENHSSREKYILKYRIDRLKWILGESMSTPTHFEDRRKELELSIHPFTPLSQCEPNQQSSPTVPGRLFRSQAHLTSTTPPYERSVSDREVFQSFLDLYDPKCPDRCYGLQYLQHAKIGVVINNSLYIHGGLNTQALRFLPSNSPLQSSLNDPRDLFSVDGTYCSDSLTVWIDKLNRWAHKEIEDYIQALAEDSDYDFNSELWIRRRSYAHSQPGSGLLMYGAYHEGRRTQPNPSIFLTFDPLPHGECQLEDAVLIAMEQDGLKNLVSGGIPFGDVPIVTRQLNSDPSHPINVIFADTSYSAQVTHFNAIDNKEIEPVQTSLEQLTKIEFLDKISSKSKERVREYLNSHPEELNDTRGFSAEEVLINPNGSVRLRGFYRDAFAIHVYDQTISSTPFESEIQLPISKIMSGKLLRPKLKIGDGHFLCSFTHGRSASNILVRKEFFEEADNIISQLEISSLLNDIQSNEILNCHHILKEDPDLLNHSFVPDSEFTPLMVAAECGHFPLVIYFTNIGALIHSKNRYGHTAIHLAIERGHQDIAIFLLQQNKECDTFNLKNNYDKNPLFSACEFGKLKVVEWILLNYPRTKSLYAYVNKSNNRGNTCLMLACAGQLTEDREKIFDALLRAGADPSYTNQQTTETVLHWAARQGHVNFLQKILSVPELEMGTLALVSRIDNKTVLESAIQQGSIEAVRLILTRLPLKHWKPLVQISSARLAWEQGSVDIATEFFMNDQIFSNDLKKLNGSLTTSNSSKIQKSINGYYDKFQIEKDWFHIIGNQLLGTNSQGLEALATYAGNSQFHFNFLLLYVLPNVSSPNVALNKLFPNFIKAMRNSDVKHQINIVSNLIDLTSVILELIETHPLEKSDLNQHLTKTLSMIKEALTCDSLEELEKMKSVLKLPKDGYEDQIVELAQLLRTGPVSKCIKKRITTIFSSTKLNQIVDQIFYCTISRLPKYLHPSSLPTTENADTFYQHIFLLYLQDFHSRFQSKKSIATTDSCISKNYCDEYSINLYNFTSSFIFVRYSPWLMFICEGLSKLGFLTIVAIVSMHRYSPDVNGVGNRPIEVQSSSALLVIYFTSMALYEWGQMTHRCNTFVPSFSTLRNYLKEDWNIFDLTSLVLVLISLCSTESSPRNYGLLAASIPFITLSLLRYLAFFPSLGVLVILFLEMCKELFSFMVIYVFCAVGFCLALWALLSDQLYDQTFSENFLYLFQVAMGNVSFFDFSDNPYSTIGVGLVFVFTLLSCVVILNLIIAQMSSTYQRIMDQSEQKFRFERAQNTSLFLLLTEKHPMCMLPAPLNLIPGLLMLSYHALMFIPRLLSSDNISIQIDSLFLKICGQFSDLLIGIPACILAPWFELFEFNYWVLFQDVYRFFLAQPQPEISSNMRLFNVYYYIVTNLVSFVFFLFLYPCYVVCLLYQLVQSIFSALAETHTPQLIESVLEIQYPKKASYFVPPPLPTQFEEHVSVKFLRAKVQSPLLDNSSTILVSLRVNGYEIFSPEPIFKGPNPLWKGDAIVNFPSSILEDANLSGMIDDYIQVHFHEFSLKTGEKTHVGPEDYFGTINVNDLILEKRKEGMVEIKFAGQPLSEVYFAITVNRPSPKYDPNYGAKRYFSEEDMDKIFGEKRNG